MFSHYVDHMGNDLSVVNAARVSFDKTSEAEMWIEKDIPTTDKLVNIPVLSERDKNLIGFLARGCSSKDWEQKIFDIAEAPGFIEIEEIVKELARMATHWTPFTHTAITLRMKAPVPIRTQCFKHKQGLTENEESRRYITSRPELFIPDCFRSAAKNKKQGSGNKHPDSVRWIGIYTKKCEEAIDLYQDMISHTYKLSNGEVIRSPEPIKGGEIIEYGIAPEQARFVLPQGVQVNWLWTGNLASFARFVNQRTDSHAQQESQDLANQVSEIMSTLYPVSWNALTGY